MEQVIKINVPEGKIAKFNPKTNVIEFIDKESVRSKSWEEFIKNHPKVEKEWFITSVGQIDHIHSESRTERHYNNLKTREDAEGILALIQLTRLHDEWVGDWKPRDKNYTILVSSANNIGIDLCYRRSLLRFPTYEEAQEFIGCFRPLLEKAKKFI